MDVKSQLVEAQIEHTTEAGLAGLTPGVGRMVFTTDSLAMYIGDGTQFRQISGARIGDVKQSMLSEADFITEHGADWILCDGRDITGSDYATLSGITNAPDLRGRFARGKDHGTGRNPDGNTALGTFQQDALQNMTGNIYVPNVDTRPSVFGDGVFANVGTSGNKGTNGGSQFDPDPTWTSRVDFKASRVARTSSETRPENVTVNFFIKINR